MKLSTPLYHLLEDCNHKLLRGCTLPVPLPVSAFEGDHLPRLYPTLLAQVLSKRKLLKLVKQGKVGGWDDPRMPTIKGLRRRGYTAQILNKFCEDIGVTRWASSMSPIAFLDVTMSCSSHHDAGLGGGLNQGAFHGGKTRKILAPTVPQTLGVRVLQ